MVGCQLQQTMGQREIRVLFFQGFQSELSAAMATGNLLQNLQKIIANERTLRVIHQLKKKKKNVNNYTTVSQFNKYRFLSSSLFLYRTLINEPILYVRAIRR